MSILQKDALSEQQDKSWGIRLWTVFVMLWILLFQSKIFVYPENVALIVAGGVLLGFQFFLKPWALLLNTIVGWLWVGLFGVQFLACLAFPEGAKFASVFGRLLLPMMVIAVLQTWMYHWYRSKPRKQRKHSPKPIPQ